MINGIGNYGYNIRPDYSAITLRNTGNRQDPATAPAAVSGVKAHPSIPAVNRNHSNNQAQQISPYAVTNEQEAQEAGLTSAQIRGLKKAGKIECSTCANRMYQDGSDENVSFKSAAHLSPEAAGAAVRSHEGEHVSNAYKKAAMNNGKVLHTGVSIHMSVCPECGRSYVSGGTTSTSIVYYGESKPQFAEAAGIKGQYIDAAV